MGNQYGMNSGSAKESYVGAPYNFVPFAKEPYALNEGSQVSHESFAEERMDGEIRYRVTAKTPIFVSDGYQDKTTKEKNPDFARNHYGEYAIPGNTMRGLIRNNLQILSDSSFAEDVDDYWMMFREVAGGADRIDRKRYSTILGASLKNLGNGKMVSILKYVKAGYIRKQGGHYSIYGTVNDEEGLFGSKLNYYIISERLIIDRYVENGSYDEFSFFFDNPEKYLQHKTVKKFWKVGSGKGAKYQNYENTEYIPYCAQVIFKVSEDGKVTSVKAYNANPEKGFQKGFVLSSGPMKNKKVIYIIPDIDLKGKCINVPREAERSYQIDYEKRKNGLKPVKAVKNKKEKDKMMQEFYNLPKEGQIKPVFYIEHGGLYFGFTPRLRLFNDYSIKDGMNDAQKEYIFDYAKSIFGYSKGRDSYKSRVSFSDAVMTKEGEKTRRKENVILAEPKPSSFADYLVQDGQRIVKTYNSYGFELRGVKQYWLHEEPVTPKASDKVAVQSSLYPLSEGTEFEGVVRFTNLDRIELGLLLWSIRLEENSLVNIGQGKAFGYGVSKIDILKVRKYDREKAYDTSGAFVLDAFSDMTAEADQMIDEYKNELVKRIGKKINNIPSLRAFLLMKNGSVIPHEDLVGYMSVDDGDYRNRTALKDVQETVNEGRQIKQMIAAGTYTPKRLGNAQAKEKERGSHKSEGASRGSGSDAGNQRGFAGQDGIRNDNQMKEGKIKHINFEKGYGFIKVQDESDDVYFRIEKFPYAEREEISKGKAVEVSYIRGNRGLQAVKCRLK